MMPDEKQLVLHKLLTKKVWRLVKTDREPVDAVPVLNRWQDTLEIWLMILTSKKYIVITP